MDSWLIVSLIEAFIIGWLLFLVFKIARILKQEETERRQGLRESLERRGRQVNAEVTDMVIRGRIKYEIYAEWCSIETEKVYSFYETFWYYRGLFGMRPKVAVGDQIKVIVNFRAPQIYLIERPR